ncbi:hypothetical protein GCM10010919_11480 [Alishewanella longhuensis]|uniref:DUF2789 domain-containing protein n=1 Tax=Alishewanella longhuensis TaxID=1091037 RepID=A0ABQ3KWM1_9ALTE|nr:DUF2789 domain-containing protein [Alishewanella longhuensis]GHG64707.1 hypothetical protein GCM10010919_11480 [Alishewanella longhuensis]
MDTSQHTLSSLFAQLGLDNDAAAIQAFINEHRLPAGTELAQADFWSQAQSSFLQEAWRADSDWSDVIDELNKLLH